MDDRIPVAVLGATGAVGQRFVSLLALHDWFEVVALTGSARSAGRAYGEAVNWLLPADIPPAARDLVVGHSDEADLGAELVFSALPSGVAREIEPKLAKQGLLVCSNASAHRMEADVPLIIPEINRQHLSLVERQRQLRGWPGLIVTSPNCATTGIAFPLKALHERFGVTAVHAVTLQAISGAGYPGVSALEISDNVIPYIPGEEHKIEQETRKLLGKLADNEIEPARMALSAQVHRVPVIDGHLAALSVQLERQAELEQVTAAIAEYRSGPPVAQLPSAPERPMLLRSEVDRPQPRLDRDALDGMAISVGRVQHCPVLDFRLISLVHNTIRGAAAGAVLNAELLVAEGYLGQSKREAALA